MTTSVSTIRNTLNKEISVLWNGKRVLLKPFEEITVAGAIAQRFVEIHGHVIEKMDPEELFGSVSEEQKPATIWIANATGNPDAPDEVTVSAYDKEKQDWLPKVIKNRFKQPLPANYLMKGAEEIFIDEDGGRSSRLHAQQSINIPAYKIAEVPYHFGQFILRRAFNSSIAGHTKVIKSREMPAWRPVIAWSIEDLRVYLSLCKTVDFRETKKYGETTPQLKVRYKGEQFDARVYQAKIDLLKHIFFCLIDPKVQLPTREDFEAAKSDPKHFEPKAAVDTAAEAAFAGA